MNRRPLTTWVVLVGLLTAGPAIALQQQLSRPALCAMSDVVVIGEVTSAETVWAEGDDGGILRRSWLATWRGIKGAPGDTVEVLLPGGTIGDVSHVVEDVPNLRIDSRYLLFLERLDDGSLQVVGGDAGAVLVAPSEGGDGESYIGALASIGSCRGS